MLQAPESGGKRYYRFTNVDIYYINIDITAIYNLTVNVIVLYLFQISLK